MAAPKKTAIPYPPTPPDLPEGLTDYSDSFTRQQNLLLAGLFLFLVFYIGAILFCAMICFWCIWSFYHWLPLKIVGLVIFGIFFLYLVKGFFKRHPMDKDLHIEITEDEHPALFGFINKLCEELDAPIPNKVFVSPDVNAACMPRTTLVNLFVEPKKDLLIGLGLVNCMNLSEFKAVLAHELGHFSQSAMASSYAYVASRIIFDLVEGEDWFDRMIQWCKEREGFKIIGYAVGGPLLVAQKILGWLLKVIILQRLAVTREREFHADLVAVSAAGSDAATHGLLRARFGMQCFIQAVRDLITAMDHKLYTNDLYLHQDRAAVVVRRKKKEPTLGLPPELPQPKSGAKIKVFDAEQDELEDEDDRPPMWRSHPSDSDREDNAKEQFVPAPIDHRSPWILFADVADLKERMTYKFFRKEFKIPKNADLTDAVKVQEFIDNEHADTTYDPKYNGIYDDRPLEPVAPDKDGNPGDLDELNVLVRDQPWTDDRIEKVLGKLYDGCRSKAEELDELRKERAILDNTPGQKSPRLKRKIKDIDKKLDTLWEWLRSLDRRVYLIHVQMAGAVNPALKTELVERYQFQLEVQRLYSEARYNQERALAFARLLFSLPPDQVHPELGAEIMNILRQSWRALKKIIQDAREINLPAMKNFEEGERLADFILEGKMVPEPPLSYVRLDWCQKLVDQLAAVRSRCFRLHCKSLGGILSLQEQVAVKWQQLREPVAAEVVEVEAVAAEVIPADVIPAEVIPAEPIAAEVIPVEVIALEVIPDVPIPASQIPQPPAATAAFVTPSASPPSPAPAPHRSPPPVPQTPASAPIAAEVIEPVAPPAPKAPAATPFDFDSPPPAPKPAPTKTRRQTSSVGSAFSLEDSPAKPTKPPAPTGPALSLDEEPALEVPPLNAPELVLEKPAAVPSSKPPVPKTKSAPAPVAPAPVA
ncbi:MAG: M48 family metallopeptidase, partial [Planctomycetia bacterium]|nr:M48 family metallopeptidase [Planctomycetia bacterium]